MPVYSCGLRHLLFEAVHAFVEAHDACSDNWIMSWWTQWNRSAWRGEYRGGPVTDALVCIVRLSFKFGPDEQHHQLVVVEKVDLADLRGQRKPSDDTVLASESLAMVCGPVPS